MAKTSRCPEGAPWVPLTTGRREVMALEFWVFSPHHHLPLPVSCCVAITIFRSWGLSFSCLLFLLTSIHVRSPRDHLSSSHSPLCRIYLSQFLKSVYEFPYSLHYSLQLLKPFDGALWKSQSPAESLRSPASFEMFFFFPLVVVFFFFSLVDAFLFLKVRFFTFYNTTPFSVPGS